MQLWQFNNLTMVHAITEHNSHQSRQFEGNEILDIKTGENKIAARFTP
ncbi:MAG: hypothetical protein ACJ71F_17685 [Nitrososphaeraceae archaeon]